MATKKKQTKSKNKKKVVKKKSPTKVTGKSTTLKKKSAKKSKRASPKKATAKTTPRGKKTSARKKARTPRKQAPETGPSFDTAASIREGLRSRSAGQSGDLQGLSNREGADSESVDELLEEGNAFEADVVKGVEDAGDEGEVHTHEVPEDDVPGEYLDEE
jgi:hypothetical protein